MNSLVLIFGLVAIVQCSNVSIIELSPDFIRNDFLSGASKIPNRPNLNLCHRQLFYISKHFKSLQIFPLIDSWGKIPPGLMTGNIWTFGNYDQCLNVKSKFPLPTLGTLEGQYCKALVPIKSSDKQFFGRSQEMQGLIGKLGLDRQSRGLKLVLQSGICIPKSCKPEEFSKLIGLKLIDCKVKEEIPFETLDYFAIALISLIAVFLILGTAYDYIYKGPKASLVLKAFSVTSNAAKLFHVSTEKKKQNIDCLNGLRVISMFWVIYCHEFMSVMGIPKINWIDMLTWTRTFNSMILQTGFISVDSFLFMSGLLLSWVGMKEIIKRDGEIFRMIPKMYFHRYIRLTPTIVFVMLFVMTFLKFFGDGPLWDQYLLGATYECKKNWWINLFYVQNYVKGATCLVQTWYLAIDFQLFLISPFILYGFWKWGKKFLMVIVVLIALSIGCVYGTFYSKGYTGALLVNDKKIPERLGDYYLYTHTRYSIFLIGMSFGWLLFNTKDKDVKIPWYVQIFGWLTSASIIFGVTMAPYFSLKSNYTQSDSSLEGASYESFGKIGWGFMLGWVVFCCYHGYGGVVNSFLSNAIWQPLSRLSFAIYMTQMTVISVVDGNVRTTDHFSNFDMMLRFWSYFGITLLCSVILVLAIESPIIGLEKVLLSPKVKPVSSNIETNSELSSERKETKSQQSQV